MGFNCSGHMTMCVRSIPFSTDVPTEVPCLGGLSNYCCTKNNKRSLVRKWPECSASIIKLQKLANYENRESKTYLFFHALPH